MLGAASQARPELPPLPAAAGAEPPIPPTAVRAGIERELADLAAVGRGGAGALREAVDMVRARIRNSAVLAPDQVNGSMCVVCGASLNDDTVAIAVLTGRPKHIVHLHGRCHEEYRRRITAAVDEIMAAAGFGPDRGDRS